MWFKFAVCVRMKKYFISRVRQVRKKHLIITRRTPISGCSLHRSEKKLFSIQLHKIKENSLQANLRDIEIKINQN